VIAFRGGWLKFLEQEGAQQDEQRSLKLSCPASAIDPVTNGCRHPLDGRRNDPAEVTAQVPGGHHV
jgi:hypothetical protein